MRICLLLDCENEVYAYSLCHENKCKDGTIEYIPSLILDDESRQLGCKMVIIDETQLPDCEVGDCYFDFKEKNLKKKLKYSKAKEEWRELENLRWLRTEAFKIGDKYQMPLVYDNLSEEQKQEYTDWRKAWLDVTEIKVIPEMPEWMK